MIIYLFGGSSPNNSEKQWTLIKSKIEEINPKEIIYLGYAKKGSDSEEGLFLRRKLFSEFSDEINDYSIENVVRSKNPLIFIDGGHNGPNLSDSVTRDEKLMNLIVSVDYLMGESKGAVFTGQKMRLDNEGKNFSTGLGLIKGTVVEGHYTQKGRQSLLRQSMVKMGFNIGIGIDEACGIKIDTELFPEKYEILGDGLVEVIKSK